MKPKKKMNLQIDCEQISEMEKSIFSEIGSDGLRFLKQDIRISPEGLMSINGDHISPLLQTNKDTLSFANDEILGRGAACVVQEGIYKPLGIKVAIKTINIYDQGKRHQIMNDIKILLGNLIKQERNGYRCNFIVTLYGAYFDQGKVKVILELMDVGSLQDIIQLYRATKVQPFIDETVLAKIAMQILCGLSYLHTNNLLHRDVKPGNVLINTAGEVKLSDFGISRQLIEGDEFSKTSVGTRSYMSPERIQGHQYSYKSDIWGFGLIMFQLATSKFPFQGKTEFDLRKEFVRVGTPILPKIYSEDFNNFISCCLSIDETKRLTALELLGHRWLMKNIGGKKSVKKWIGDIRQNFSMLARERK